MKDRDVFIITHKVVSKAEGRVVNLEDVQPSSLARRWARHGSSDPRVVELALAESRRVVRMDRGVLITETVNGVVCANSGVDQSNMPRGEAALLPADPDRSAIALRQALEEAFGVRLGVVITDTTGRPWRQGLVNIALGVSGLNPFLDLRGTNDAAGRPLRATLINIADELASAADLVMGKTKQVPAVLVRGFIPPEDTHEGPELFRPWDRDLFR